MLRRMSAIQQRAALILSRLLNSSSSSRSFSCAQKRIFGKNILATARFSKSRACRTRSISIKSVLGTEPQEQRARSSPSLQRIQRPDVASQLRDLANDMAASFEKTESAILCRWADRLRTVTARNHDAEPQIGVLYAATAHPYFIDAVKSTTLASGSDQRTSFMAMSEAEGNSEAFADWLFSCDRIVVVAGRMGIVQALALSNPSVAALQLHPDTVILVDGLEKSSSAIDAFSSLLLESLQLLGIVSAKKAVGKLCSVKPGSDLESLQRQMSEQHRSEDGANTQLLASALEAAILCAEHSGQLALSSSANTLHVSNKQDIHLASSQNPQKRSVVYSVAEASRSMQRDFENGDLVAVDVSMGEIKHRTSK
ncbi:hypothetical protein J3B02_003917, partial [Coemansia erecta]